MFDKTYFRLVEDVAKECVMDLSEAVAVIEYLELNGFINVKAVTETYAEQKQ